MEKFPELTPEQLEYFRNIFYNSDIFKEKIQNLREKYWIKMNPKEKGSMFSDTVLFFMAWERLVDLEYNEEEKNIWNSFEKDLLDISQYFGMVKYYKYLKKYVLFRWFEPLLFQKIIRFDNDKINLELPFQITKDEFNKIRRDIKSAQKSVFAKRLLGDKKIKERFKKWNFDNKFYYYRNKFFHEPLPENLSKLLVDESNKFNRISEIEKLINSL